MFFIKITLVIVGARSLTVNITYFLYYRVCLLLLMLRLVIPCTVEMITGSFLPGMQTCTRLVKYNPRIIGEDYQHNNTTSSYPGTYIHVISSEIQSLILELCESGNPVKNTLSPASSLSVWGPLRWCLPIISQNYNIRAIAMCFVVFCCFHRPTSRRISAAFFLSEW